ncbi:hypothetical protein BKA19_2857 [Blastococcus saxobsidens]|uniref:Uncharacterized protein n=1 Tax=Blastococcus saxobsidens TaxID=138336 RepID=A0A4Q7YAE2_9ACTN|nr:hypothetical protein BKA19_2857 [Blastococcus saxobsidens]
MTEDEWEDLVDRFVDGEVTRGHMFGCRGLRTGRPWRLRAGGWSPPSG